MRWLPVVLAVLVLAPAARAGDPPPVVRPPGDLGPDLGAQLFAANCASCHGSRGQGVAPRSLPRQADDLPGAGPSLRGVGAQAADFYLSTGYMPVRNPADQPDRSPPSFDAREQRALVAYIASMGTGPGVPDPHGGSVARGFESFSDHCAGCHQVVGEGGVVTGAKAPPLGDATAAQIAEAVRIGPWVMPNFSRKAISDAELDDIVRYVRYAAHPRDPGGWSLDHLGPFPEGMVTWLIAIVALLVACRFVGRRVST